MSAIMISIQPQWVEKILNGEKTIEIRKTMPKSELPVKVYIYCTNNKKYTVAPFRFVEGWRYKKYDNTTSYANGCTANIGEDINGKVIAEFTLNRIDTIEICDPDILINGKQCKQANLEKECRLRIDDIMNYVGYGDDHDGWGRDWDKGYLWHINDLKIYDRPKELSEFEHYKKYDWWDYGYHKNKPTYELEYLERPPQSWCYVEELENI